MITYLPTSVPRHGCRTPEGSSLCQEAWFYWEPMATRVPAHLIHPPCTSQQKRLMTCPRLQTSQDRPPSHTRTSGRGSNMLPTCKGCKKITLIKLSKWLFCWVERIQADGQVRDVINHRLTSTWRLTESVSLVVWTPSFIMPEIRYVPTCPASWYVR